MQKKLFIISLGGSLVVPNSKQKGVDIDFIKNFRAFILEWVKKGYRFYIFIGGGRIAREYIEQARELGVEDPEKLDEVGIYSTWLNGMLLQAAFGESAFCEVVKDPTKKVRCKAPVIFAGGYKPGCSTDTDAVLAAIACKAKTVINLSNIDFLYDKDPSQYTDAVPLKETTFSNLLNLTGSKWTPGLNSPFDPIASQLARKEKITIAIMNGKNLDNLNNFLLGKEFIGSIIKPK